MVRERGGRGEPAAVAAHHLVDDEHPRVRRVLGDDVAGVQGALLGGGPRAERLPDRHHVVVDGLGEPDHRELVVVAAQVRREVGGGAVGVVAADRVQDVDTVAAQLLGSHVQRVLPGLDEASLDAVIDVGELDPAVADRAAPERVQPSGSRPHLVGHLHGIAGEQAGIPVAVGDDPHVRRDLGVPLDQAADGGGEAGREAACGEHGNGGDRHAPTLPTRHRRGQTDLSRLT